MLRDLTPRSALRIVSLAIALLALAVAPLPGQAPIFSKTLKKVNGVTISITPAALSDGDLLDWVITYQFGQSAQVNIEDLLPPTLQFVGGSLQAPPSWVKQWFNGTSWVSVEPGSATGVGAVVGLGPVGTGATFLLPAPPSAPVNTTGSGGDGYRAIPYKDTVHNTDNVYIVNHHASGTYLDCFGVATGVHCPGYPAHPTVTSGASYSANGDNTTSGQPIEYLDRVNGRLYFPVIKTSSSELGFLCADLRVNKSCGFYSLSPFGTDLRSIQGIGAVGTKLYAQLPNGRIGCLDTSPATPIPCAGQPYAAVATSFDPYWDSSEVIGTRIYSVWQAYDNPTSSSTLNTTVPYILGCFDTTTSAPCAGWGPKTPDPTGIIGILYPLLDAFGTVGGVCVHTTNPPSTVPPSTTLSSAFRCYDLSTGNLLTSPANYPANYGPWAQTFAGGWYQAAGYGQSGYYKARVFNGNYGTVAPSAGAIGCYDFAASAPCAEPLFPLKGAGVADKHYATIADPERPGCMWYYGDDGKLGSFEAADGSACGATTLLDAIVTPADSYCAGGAVSGWDKLSVAGLALGGGVTATLTIYDGNNPSVVATAAGGTPYAQNLPVTSLPVILGSSGLGIGYGPLPGQYKSLRIVLQFNGVTNHTPWTLTPPPSAEVTWFGDPPQFCFQTKVATCEGPVVTNQASAVTTPFAGPPFNNVAPSPAFSAAHVLGADCTGGLTINKSLVGAPSGFNGTFLFNVTCSTPNGPLQQQLSVTWPNTAVILTGIPFGSTCLVSEDSALPPLPAGSSWSGVPVSIPASGAVVIIKGGKNQISFANQVRACDDRGHVKITKKLLGVPSGFSGTFNFNLSCLSGTTLITQQAQITLPGSSSSVTLNGIPVGSSCLVTEAPPLPPLPAGWFWLAPSYLPASGQVVLAGNCCPEVEVTDRAKFCCTDAGGAVPQRPETKP